jgi:hypothetical protein
MSLGSYYSRVVELQQQERYQDALKVLEEGVVNKDPMSAWYLHEQISEGIWMKRDPERLDSLVKEFEKEWEPLRLLMIQNEVTEGFMNEVESLAFKENDPTLFHLYYELSENLTNNNEIDKKAYEYLLKSANMGYAVAQNTLSELDRVDNIYWTRKAAEQGHPMCMWSLGLRLFREGKFAAAGYWIWKLITETQPGKTTGRACGFWNENIQVFMKLHNCKKSLTTFLAIRRFRKSELSLIPKDVIVLIAKELWKTNQEECWEDKEFSEQIIKKIKRST